MMTGARPGPYGGFRLQSVHVPTVIETYVKPLLQ